MAHVLIMPRQGNTVESCIIQEWKVKEGDSVNAGTTVCIVETDKATFDVPAGADGLVLKILHPAGDDVPVLEPIAVIGMAGEDPAVVAAQTMPDISGNTSRKDVVCEQTKTQRGEKAGNVEQGVGKENTETSELSQKLSAFAASRDENTHISPRAKNLAAKEGIPATMPVQNIDGSGPGGRIIERDIKAALRSRAPLTAAAKTAIAAGAAVPAAGTGIGGRVTSADINAFAEGAAATGATNAVASTAASIADARSASAFPGEGAVTETPIKGIRKIIADKMLASLSQSAQFTLNASANAVQLQELRNWFKSKGDSKNPAEAEAAKITVNDIILYAVSRVLPSYQYMNAHKAGEVLRTYERVHLGMAVDTPRGLMVPVIRNADQISLKQISAEAKRLASVCQNGTAKPDELTGSTFTVSNLGSFGITGFTPVLNTPEVAILGVCGIELKPVESNDDEECAFAFAPHIGFSLTINHQVVDGAPAARFLKALCEAVENIYLQLAAG